MSSREEISKEEAEDEEEWGEDDRDKGAGLFEGLGSGLDDMRSREEIDEEDDGYKSLSPFGSASDMSAKPDNDKGGDDDNIPIRD